MSAVTLRKKIARYTRELQRIDAMRRLQSSFDDAVWCRIAMREAILQQKLDALRSGIAKRRRIAASSCPSLPSSRSVPHAAAERHATATLRAQVANAVSLDGLSVIRDSIHDAALDDRITEPVKYNLLESCNEVEWTRLRSAAERRDTLANHLRQHTAGRRARYVRTDKVKTRPDRTSFSYRNRHVVPCDCWLCRHRSLFDPVSGARL